VGTSLRLVRDDEVTVDQAAGADARVQELQTEIQALSQEVNLLRRRDEMVHFYLHRLDEELRLASRLQQDFLPKALPELGAARFHTLFRPAGYVSGDLFDVFRLDDTHVAFYLADAIGHGVPAALLTMFLRTSLVTMEIVSDHYRIMTPAETMGRLNQALLRQNFSQTTFATAIYGIVEVNSGLCSIARAGHPCPILIPSPSAGDDAKIVDLDDGGGALLGVFADETYTNTHVQLTPGDRLLIHSDGIDSVFGDNMENYVLPWRQELEQLRSADAAKMLGEFSARLDRQSGSLAPKDDLTIIAVEMTSPGPDTVNR
jgi:sigma-B regulation protein RsbU (phosphoserine phosphatase)